MSRYRARFCSNCELHLPPRYDARFMAEMDILRKDSIFADIPDLSKPPVIQTSFLIPVAYKLLQIFVYLPADAPQSEMACPLGHSVT